MALVSPGVSISVVDESVYVGAGPGTIPLLFVATQQDKFQPDGVTIAPGTTKANVGKLWSITSQRDLVQTFGNPVFYQVSGSSLNGYPLNEYGLLAAYSYLGISNLCRVVRADIDTAQLQSTAVEPTSPMPAGTYWLDETSSQFGLFTRSGTAPNEIWTPVTISYFENFETGSANTPASTGSTGEYAVMFETVPSRISYWVKESGGWVQLGDTGSSPNTEVIVSSVWPDLNTVTENYWIKTTAPAQGANIVLRRMSATTGSFVQVESPILADDTAANTYYSTDPTESLGKIYIEPIISGSSPLQTNPNCLQINVSTTAAGSWSPLANIIGSITEPVDGPDVGQLWFNAELGVDGDGYSTVDLMWADGTGSWQNVVLPGFTSQVTIPGAPTLYAQSLNPQDDPAVLSLSNGDIWVNTDALPYPQMYRWNSTSSAWVAVDLTNQTTPSGIIFRDARPNPMFFNGTGTGENNGGGSNPDLDPDAPDADAYPPGFLLWNTRYSTQVVKEWSSPYVYNGVPAVAYSDPVWGVTAGRWVNISGNKPDGAPYMGDDAQRICIVRAIQASITMNEDVKAEDIYFNLLAAPGYVEAIDELLVLNTQRKETAFVVGDTPFTLSATGTSLQNWATNSSGATGNGEDGLVTISKYCGVYYPSGLATNVDGTDVVVPPSHMALRTIAYNDQVAYPWFAPAGLQRGVVQNAAAVGYVNPEGQFIPIKLNEGQRDILYTNGINPIRVMPTGGIVVFGQKTRQSFASATDRINVVRLENYLRYKLNELATPFLFEQNDTTTRQSVKDAFDRFLSELITLRALYDFLTVCDLTNNTPARIDRNELWIDVAIQPVKAIEFIYIPIRIRNTGASLSI